MLRAIASRYRGRLHGIHGLSHWGRVLENGERLAAGAGADMRVVQLFAVFHDACRVNDGIDPGHGERGAGLARAFRGEYFELDDAAMAELETACIHHTDGRTDGSLTVRVCYDADRLDLLRCQIMPRPERLATDQAREPALLDWACRRARDHVEPAVLATTWRGWLEGDGRR
ncbi:hypothetical protein GF314_10355 [bacterium]|nr:hypothetical protein [bacterium]